VASFVETQGHAGDEGHFEALYTTYRSEVQRLASYLLRNAADAEDASQTVFVNVLRALRQGVRPAEPRAWLLAITRNVCFSRGRAAAARPDEVELDPDRLPEPDADDTPGVDEIVGALARMLPNQRTALILRDFRGAPHSEICELMALSSAGAETLLTRARVSFREEIEAGEQPFDCAETKALVEEQLAGVISASGRHSLRTHLRHCASCSTLARSLRSSAGKVAGFLLLPFELVSRLASALSQASTAVHVATAIGSTAAIATVAIPVAVTHSPAADHHLEGRAPSATHLPRAKAAASASTRAVHTTVMGLPRQAAPAAAGPSAPGHVRAHPRTHVVAHTRTASAKGHLAKATSVRNADGTASPAATPAGTTEQVRTTPPIANAPQPISPPAAVAAPDPSKPKAAPPHTSPPVRISVKPKPSAKPKAKPERRGAPARGGGRRPPDTARPMGPLSPGTTGPTGAAPGSAPVSSDPGSSGGSSNSRSSSGGSATKSSSGDSTTSTTNSRNANSSTNNDNAGGSNNNTDSGNGHNPKPGHNR
jgi:RNA polymerase sigma factor (sigma-70 family)